MMGHGGLAGVIVERRWSWATAQAKWEHTPEAGTARRVTACERSTFGLLAFVG